MKPLAAINYLVPPADYFWHWSDDGPAAEWEDGSTICLWLELHALLHQLAPHGLPPLGSILLVLMACGKKVGAAVDSITRTTWVVFEHFDTVPDFPINLLPPLATALETIEALPEDLRTGLSARANLLIALFEGIEDRQTPEHSQKILRQIDVWGLEQLKNHEPVTNSHSRLRWDIQGITDIKKQPGLTNLETRLRTGLEFEEIQPAQVPEPPSTLGESALPLLRQLEKHQDHELSALAAVARRMVAMFAVTRPTGFPRELPVGGISDITNRGPLDRLLLSELATDDTILMARLANNEALYLHRETPPDEPAIERVILMDSGIQLWGLPRLYTLAAALGLQDSNKGDAVTVLRREGGIFKALPLKTVGDVRLSLQSLLPDPDPGPALEAFDPAGTPGRPDVFFLTATGMREPVRQTLHRLACRISAAGGRFYIITVSRGGALELSVRNPAGTRIIAAGRIDPDEILRSSTKEKPTEKASDLLTNLPALIRHLDFYRQYPLPFRFPAISISPNRDFPHGNLRVNVDGRRRLMMWDPSLPGAVEIAAGMPPARDYHPGRHGEQWVVICSGNAAGDRASVVRVGMNQPTRVDHTLASTHPFPRWIKCQNGAAVLGYSVLAEACSLEDGSRLHSLDLPEGTQSANVVFDGKKLGLATEISENPPSPPASEPPPTVPPVLGTPVSAGFVASGTLVIRAQGGRWELAMSEFLFKPSLKVQVASARPFRPIAQENNTSPDSIPSFYMAEWNADCRLIFDTRGIVHLLFSDNQGRVELSILGLISKPAAAWVAHWPEPHAGNAEWFCKPSVNVRPALDLVPLLQRFAALARSAKSVQDWRESADESLTAAL